ncbi:two-component regulator propeller domain-containing protein [Gracilimonas sp.]|uniref:type IX secretion system anionic LPS delivery protein PorZ n=1 Tax=Gracilimonas sp. TaxID=1974203 RepID=UPI0032EC83C2
MIKKLFFLSILASISVTVYSQNLQSWGAYPSYSTINSISVNQDIVYSATLGGIFSVEGGEIMNRMTTLDGLYRSNPTAIIADKDRLIAGYIDGTIDVIYSETNEVERIEDIKRVSRFNSKSINAFEIYENRLYVATSFGIVVYNLQNLFVENSYLQLGAFDIGVQVNNFDIFSDTLYAATVQGVAYGSLNTNLVEKDNWTNFTEDDGLPANSIQEIQLFNENINVLVDGSIYFWDNSSWSLHPDFAANGIQSLQKSLNGEELGVATASAITIIDSDLNSETINFNLESTITDFRFEGERVFVGTTNEGLVILEDRDSEPQFYLPTGPYLNFFGRLMVDENTLIASSTSSFPSADAFAALRGYYIYKDGTWNNFNSNTDPALSNIAYVYSIGANDSSFYFGSWGDGIIRHNKSNNEVTVYDRSNSSLVGIDENQNYVVISGLDEDSQNNMWAISYWSDFPLYVQLNGTEEWIPFRGRAGADLYFNLFVDSFDQKWISLVNSDNVGQGLLIVETGDPSDPNDDSSVELTSSIANGNLPDDKINAIVQDKNGEVWIGTGRGIARFIFPELIVDGGPDERQAQWLINEDTTAASRFLLRDVNVSAMAVNDANQKWIGSVNQGIWVLNAEGSRIINRFTTENSNLISNNIEAISIDDETGEVFIATELGLISYYDIPKAPVNKMDKLKVFPNPFQYSKHNQIVVEGLSESTRIKVLGVDGIVVNELEARGGRISWDGFDYNGNRLGTGVYFLIAYEDSGRETGVGKVVIVK